MAVTALLVALAGVAIPTLSKPRPSSVNTEATDVNQRFNISGKVEAVDYAANSVRINASGQRVEILITPTTAIEFRREAGSIADIHRGRRISASGVLRDGVYIANSIILH